MDDAEALGDIYEAVGDPDRWRRLHERLGSALHTSPELTRHFEIARRLHEHHLDVTREIRLFARVHNLIAAGAIVVDGAGLIIHVNDTASAALGERDGLEVLEGRVRAVNPTDDMLLQRAIAAAASGDEEAGHLESSCIPITRARRQPFIVHVIPPSPTIRSFVEDCQAVTLVVIDPTDAFSPAIDIVRGLYGFTEREGALAALLMRGLSVKDAAAELGVAITTARTFLASLVAKTDSHNQAELMRRLLAIPLVAARQRHNSQRERSR